MKILRNKKKFINKIRSINTNIGFIPTMGGLHEGHLSLIKNAKKKGLTTVVSIFVNPTQFNNKNDYKKYPRNTNSDIKLLKSINPTFLFLPKVSDLLIKNKNKKIIIDKFNKLLCGKYRPGHFNGVINIIDVFLKIINPKYIFLGEKDYQQLILIKKYIKNKHRTRVISCKTIRDKNGLALSTRNFLLTDNQKIIGSNVYKIIKKNKNKFKLLINKVSLLNNLKKKILYTGVTKIEYLKLIDTNTNKNINKKTKKFRIFISYYLKNVRLIDNV